MARSRRTYGCKHTGEAEEKINTYFMHASVQFRVKLVSSGSLKDESKDLPVGAQGAFLRCSSYDPPVLANFLVQEPVEKIIQQRDREGFE